MRWVRPDLTVVANSSALASREDARCSSAGTSWWTVAEAAATWMEVGNVSLLDWLAFTWSLGCTSTPARCAREASTSFMFMFDDVPEPVWKTSIGNWSRWCPSTISAAAARMASACSELITPSSAFTLAAAALTCAIALTCSPSRGLPLIGKFSTAGWVCARHRACSGTWISPMLSRSMRYPFMPPRLPTTSLVRALALRPGTAGEIEPVLLVAGLQSHGERDGRGRSEHPLHRLEQVRCLRRRPHHHGAAGPQDASHGPQELRAIDLRVLLVDQGAGTVVDVEEDQVEGRGPALGHRLADVGGDHPEPFVRQQRRAVRHRPVACPGDERLLELDDHQPLDPPLPEHLTRC